MTGAEPPKPPRLALLMALPGLALLVLGLTAGLLRLGLWPGPPQVGLVHGPLMVCGFFGTLIGLERAMAARASWAWLAPAASATGAALALAGLRPVPCCAWVRRSRCAASLKGLPTVA